MKINYQEILKKNMINVFKDVLLNIKNFGLQENHHLYITFNTENKKVKIPEWLKKKYPQEITIVIQYEYWNFKVNKNSFNISLSFQDIITNLSIPFDSVISFADPYANFGLKLKQNNDITNPDQKNFKKKKKEKQINKTNKDNIIDFKTFKKN